MPRRFPIILATLLIGFLTGGCVIIPVSWPSPPEVRQVVYQKGSGIDPSKIAIIDISGVLTGGGAGDGFFSNDSSIVDLTRKLHNAKEDNDVEAVVLRIDSPGGGVTASDIMYHELMKFKDETTVPVYVSMQTVAASGGYYISMAADKIYATPTSITGSIGVIATFPEARGVMNKVGLEMNAITSGKNKDAGAFYKAMTDEDRKLYQDVVDDMYGKFVEIVGNNRSAIEEAKVRELADGRIYTATQALEAGLIDDVAYLDEIVGEIESELGLGTAEVVIIKRSGGDRTTSLYARDDRDLLPESAKKEATQINLVNIDMNAWSTPTNEVFNYLWVP